MDDDHSLATESLALPELISVNRTLGKFYGPGVLETWCKKNSPPTPGQFMSSLAEFMSHFPPPLEPLSRLVRLGAIPIIYVPGWLETERSWTREYLVVMVPREWYHDLMEQLTVLSETTICNVVDAEFENIIRKNERLTGIEIDKEKRRVSLVIRSEEIWFGMKYFDTSIFPHVGKIISEDILAKYLCVTIWDKSPKLSTQILKIMAGFAQNYSIATRRN